MNRTTAIHGVTFDDSEDETESDEEYRLGWPEYLA
jgi:hypothetical protein